MPLKEIFEEEFKKASRSVDQMDIFAAEEIKAVVDFINEDGFFEAAINTSAIMSSSGRFCLELKRAGMNECECIYLQVEKDEGTDKVFRPLAFLAYSLDPEKFDLSSPEESQKLTEAIGAQFAKDLAKRQYDASVRKMVEGTFSGYTGKLQPFERK